MHPTALIDVRKTQPTSPLPRILDLAAGTYCIGLVVEDEAGNRSGLSNVVQIYTPDELRGRLLRVQRRGQPAAYVPIRLR